jgi:4'-phosphopantetheinyl transferase EntD
LSDLPVVVEELWFGDEAPGCDPRELAQVAGAVVPRRIEYAAGRHCARAALAKLDIHDFVLLNTSDRCPAWPAGIVGSITHTGRAPRGYCAVALASTARVLALGIDAEQTGPLDPGLWELIARPAELRALQRVGDAAGWHAKLLFVAKEAFYKAQFPLTRAQLDFHDVEVELDFAAGRFEVMLVASVAGNHLSSAEGRFRIDGRCALAAVVALHGPNPAFGPKLRATVAGARSS